MAIDPLMRDAVQHHRAGDLQAAETLYRQIIALDSLDAHARHNLGTLLVVKGQIVEGLALVRSALEISPRDANFSMSLAECLFLDGQNDQARRVLEQAIHRGLAGRRVEQLQSQLNQPTPTAAECETASQLLESGHVAAAEAAGRDLTHRFPGHFHGWLLLATALHTQGRIEEALTAVERAYELAPLKVLVLNARGVLQTVTGRLPEAEASLVTAAQLNPRFDKVQSNLGVIYAQTGRTRKAEEAFRRATALAPNSAEAHSNLGIALRDLGRFQEAEVALREAIRLKPDYADAWSNLGVVHRETGRLAEAELAYRNVLALQPINWATYSNLLFAKNYSSNESPLAKLEEARVYGAAVEKAVQRPFDAWRTSSEGKLRIGFVSGDLRDHAVSYFLEGLLQCIDRERFELYGYPTNALADTVTTRLRAYFIGWRPLVGLGDDAAARRIYDDGIHILIDLSGHTAHNRLPVFARKPAPVQFSWLGYFATTGVTAIDYLLADPVSVPTEHFEHFSERIWHLPETRLCFSPPTDAPDVAPLPARTHHQVTFGTFQNITKINDGVLRLWARILDSMPSSRLRVQCRQLTDPAVVQVFRQRLTCAGINLSNVDLLPPVARQQYLAAHAAIDMILDTFPFPGGTTTCEALWMGVPTLTLRGGRMIGLQGASLLSAANMAEWIADDEEQFVKKGIGFASDLPALAKLRAGLRSQIARSHLCDAPRFARAFEGALEKMWQDFGDRDVSLLPR